MKHPVITFIAGTAAGTLATMGSLFIAGRIINKKMSNAEAIENARHESVLTKMKTLLVGTKSEVMIEVYTDIINNARIVFENDYSVILDRLEMILDSNTDPEMITGKLENYISALDILHDYCAQEKDDTEEPAENPVVADEDIVESTVEDTQEN